MASVQKVQSYLAYWFQLGKPVVFHNRQTLCLPCPVFNGNQFSQSFQHCWQQIMERPFDCYLSGTDETIATLLTDEWDVVGCARCPMLVPLPVRGIKVSPCPCADLPNWPNDQIPMPRVGVSSADRLAGIRQRLDDWSSERRDRLQSAYLHSPGLPQPPSALPQTTPKTLSEKPLPDAR